MELIDIYRSIKNPLDEPGFIDLLIDKYGESKERVIDLYTLLIKTAKKENVGRLYEADKDKFYAGLFNAWKNNVVSLSRQRFEDLKSHGFMDDSFIKLRNYLLKVPNVKTEAEARKILHGSYTDKELKDAFEKYAWDKDGHYSSWEYLSSSTISAYRTNSFNIEHRFYLNADPLDILKLSMIYIKKCEQRNMPYEFKFAKTGGRDDTIVIYTNTKYILDTLSIINEIKKEYPEIYERFSTPPLLTGKIDNKVGYGSEPVRYNRKESYSSIRVQKIDEAITEELNNWIKDNYFRLITFRNNTIHIHEYLSVLLAEKILKEMKASYFYNSDYETKLAKKENRPYDKKVVIENLGYSEEDLNDPKFKNYLYQIILRNLSEDFIKILNKESNESEIEIDLRHKKKYVIQTNKIKYIIESIAPMINKKDPEFKERVKNAIMRKFEEVGIDSKNIAFDKDVVEKFKSTPTPEIHKPIVKNVEKPIEKPMRKTEQKPMKVVAVESTSVMKLKESPFLHTTYIPSQKLVGKLEELLDYEPDKVLPFIYENMNAIRLLFPVLIRKNKELADQFIDSNINDYPELQNIYDEALKRIREI